MTRLRLTAALALAVAACGGEDEPAVELPRLPAHGSTPAGENYTFDVTRGERGKRCLALNTRSPRGASSSDKRCSPPRGSARSAPAVQLVLTCASRDLSLYGVVGRTVDVVRLVRPGQTTVAARRFTPPAGHEGTPFLIITRAGRAGSVESVDGEKVVWRRALPAWREICTEGRKSDDAVGTL
jgi:hypothetical protein